MVRISSLTKNQSIPVDLTLYVVYPFLTVYFQTVSSLPKSLIFFAAFQRYGYMVQPFVIVLSVFLLDLVFNDELR